MQHLKYRIVPRGAGKGVVPLNLVFIDKKDIAAAGLSYLEACELVGKDLKEDCASINIMDQDAVTVTSDGIMADSAVVAFASVDHGRINPDFGFLNVSEIPDSAEIRETEPHMQAQWDSDYYRGKKLYRGPNAEDRGARDPHNENMTISGRIANNNTGSEMMNLIEMTEILVPFLGQIQIMRGGDVLLDLAGSEVSVGIGMVVRERQGRIFGWQYGAGKTAHNSGEYAKTVKSDYPAIVADKKTHAEYVLRALDSGMVPGKHIGCSPVNLKVAKAYGKPIAFDNIEERAWEELASVGIFRKDLEVSSKAMTREEVIENAESILPGMDDAPKYNASELVEIRTVAI